MDGLSLSPVGMLLQAGPVGKAVMATLLIASLWCWVLIVEGVVTVARLARAVRAARAGASTPLFEPIEAAGRAAARLSVIDEGVGDKRRRVAETMRRAGRELLMRAEGGLPNLAVIASVAPFIGLFGTVYGIMTSFANIAEAKDTSLAVVAPGIAEALAATAWGLAAAIPAVVAYNRLGAALARAGQKLGHRIDERAVEIVAAPQVKLVKEVA